MRPRARRPATVPPAMSTCDMIQPPKMSPFWFASAGIGMTRSAGCFPAGKLSTTSGRFPMLQIVELPAAERGEAGAEDEAGVGEVGVGDDALDDRSLRLLEVGGDQGVDQALVVRPGLALGRLAVLPAVDALAGLLAELASRHLVGKNARNIFFRRIFCKTFTCSQADVEADGVGELGRAHRHAEGDHRRVERLRLRAFVEQLEGRLHVRS